MTQYPDGDKPVRIFTAYRCPWCNKQINVWQSRGETLEDVWRLHRMNCRVRVERDGGDVCKHLGPVTGESVKLGGCGGGEVALFSCPKHRFCLPYVSKAKMRRAERQVPFCAGCNDYDPIAFKNSNLCGQEVARRATETMASALDPDQGHSPSSKPAESQREAE